MATTDPKYLIKDIIEDYITANPITKDDDINPANDVHIYERGPEDFKHLFYTEDVDVAFFYGEPRVRSTRQIQDVPVHFLMSYPVTVATVDKHAPMFGGLKCTASIMQAKARTALRDAVADSAQSDAGDTPAYELTVTQEQGNSQWSGGLNIWKTEYTLEWTTGGP